MKLLVSEDSFGGALLRAVLYIRDDAAADRATSVGRFRAPRQPRKNRRNKIGCGRSQADRNEQKVSTLLVYAHQTS